MAREPDEYNSWPDEGEVPAGPPMTNPPRFGYNQGTGHSHRRPPMPVTRKKRKWPWYVGGAILLLLILISCGAILSSGGKNQSANPPVVVAPAPSQAIQAPPAATPTEDVLKDSTSFGDGEWLVGVGKEIQPGVYRTPGAQERNNTYFCGAVVEVNDTPVDSASSQGVNQPARITLKAGQTVTSTGCQRWQKVG